jgi:RNA polymerase sigma factor (sigma-70 family)
MIDALRREAWPRGVRRIRRELEAAREDLRRELGAEPSLADLAARVGSDEARLGKTIVRIHTIESTSPLSAGDHPDATALPAVLVPSEPPAPDKAYETAEVKARVRTAIMSLPPRERKVVSLYYFGEVTMKAIGAEIGVNESRVSQLHARAIQRLRKALAGEFASNEGQDAKRGDVVEIGTMLKMAKATLNQSPKETQQEQGSRGVVLDYRRPNGPQRETGGFRPQYPARRAAAR